MTVFFKSHQIIIRRNRSIGNNKFNMSATYTGYQADIQPSTPQRIDLAGGRIGSTFTGFVDATVDIKEGDQIVANGYTYSVRGVSLYQGAHLLDHKELMLFREDARN